MPFPLKFPGLNKDTSFFPNFPIFLKDHPYPVIMTDRNISIIHLSLTDGRDEVVTHTLDFIKRRVTLIDLFRLGDD